MNVVSFGGGTNSTAMIVGMYLHEIPVDLILFADPGAEQPHTYEYIEVFDKWLVKHGLPEITPVHCVDKDGNRLTLEQECLRSGTLPSIAYRFKKCSIKHKIGPQEKYGAAPTLQKVKGLGRHWSWESYIAEVQRQAEFEAAQITFDDLFPESPAGAFAARLVGATTDRKERDTFTDDSGAPIVGRVARPEEELPELPVAFVPHWKTCGRG